MPNELGIAEGYIYTKLANDSQMAALALGGFHSESAPRGTGDNGVVYVVWGFQGGPDVYTSQRIATEPLILVRAVMKTHAYEDLQAAADRIDDLLDGSNGMYAGHRVAAVRREDMYALAETDQNEADSEWRHLGGYYRFYVQ